MATPSLAMIPSAYADSKVYSVLPNNGDGDFTFNRDSSATRVGQNGLIQTVGFFGNELVTNGDFATDTDWTKPTGATISGGFLNLSGVANGQNTFQSSSIVVGKTYKATFTISNYVAGGLRILIGATGTTPTRNSNGTFTATVNAALDTVIYLQALGTTTLKIDNVSVKEVLGDQPRLNYDISNGVVQSCPSLLLEPASTNIITYSQDFSNSYWTKSGSSITSDTTTSPDGSLNADKLVEDTSTGQHQIYPPSTSGSDAVRTISFFVKPDGVTKIGIRNNDGKYISYDISTGTTLDKTITNDFVSTDMTNGWKRLSVSWDDTTPATGARFFLLDNAYTSGNPLTYSYTGNGTNGIYLYGFQTEEQTYATSYIPNFGQSAGVTRAVETCFNSSLTNYIGQTEGTMFIEFVPQDQSSLQILYQVRSNTGTIGQVDFRLQGGLIRALSNDGGSSQFNINGGSYIAGSKYKVAIRYKLNDSKLYINGVSVGNDTNCSFTGSSLNQLSFAENLNGFIPSAKIYDARLFKEPLTDAQLQTLTTL